VTDARVTSKLLTGLSVTGGAVVATDTILQAFGKVQNQINSKVSSVGLTMPAAFSVANSPITSAGTLAVTAIGAASQYIRGDGALADFPTTGGGGSSVAYYLNGSVSQGTIGGNAYYEMNKTPVIGTGTDFTIAADGYIAQFITDANDPASLLIPAGNWNVEMYFSASSSGGTPSFYVEVYKYNGTTFTLLGSSATTPEGITNGTAIDIYYTSVGIPETVLTITDRLAIRVYVTHSGRTITLHTEDNHLSEIVTTFSNGLTALNGLTKQAQYFSVDTHTFNIPSASASNRGLITTGTQTFAGQKTFIDAVILNSTLNLTSGALSIIYNPANTAYWQTYVDSSNVFNFGFNGTNVKASITSGGNITGVTGTFTGQLTLGSTITNGTYTYTLPSATGTLALTSALTGYVPYTGATGAVNLGAYDLTVNGVNIGQGGGSIATNTRVGITALNLNSTGSGNTALGNNAMYYNTTGSNNTAIGNNALINNTTGNSNVAIGITAGSSTNAGAINQLSSNSVYIGYGAYASASGNTNEIVIGEGSRGGGSNSATLGNTSITTTILHGNTSIGYTTNPSLYKLDVNGTGRFTGALSGTSATFSDNVTLSAAGTNKYIQYTNNNGSTLITNALNNNSYITGALSGEALILSGTVGKGLRIGNTADNVSYLSFASTGTATFSGAITSSMSNNTQIFNSASATTGYQYMNIQNTSGRLYMGIEGSSAAQLTTGNTAYSTTFGSLTATDLFLATNQTARLKIDGSTGEATFSQDVKLGNTSQARHLDLFITAPLDGKVYWGSTASPRQSYIGADGTPRMTAQCGGSGGVQLTLGATSWSSLSDERLKNVNSNIDFAIDKLMTLNAINFSWKYDDTNKENIGLIAQEIEKVFPQVIDKNKLPSKDDEENIDETEYLSVRYTELIPVLVKAIQELSLEIEELKALINK
jgi:hypothetical protein